MGGHRWLETRENTRNTEREDNDVSRGCFDHSGARVAVYNFALTMSARLLRKNGNYEGVGTLRCWHNEQGNARLQNNLYGEVGKEPPRHPPRRLCFRIRVTAIRASDRIERRRRNQFSSTWKTKETSEIQFRTQQLSLRGCSIKSKFNWFKQQSSPSVTNGFVRLDFNRVSAGDRWYPLPRGISIWCAAERNSLTSNFTRSPRTMQLYFRLFRGQILGKREIRQCRRCERYNRMNVDISAVESSKIIDAW